MMEIVYFLGRFHVVILHLPIGIIITAVLLEYASKRPGFENISSAGNFLWGLAATTAVITVLLGMMHATEGGFEGQSFFYHRIFGIGTAAVTTAICLLRIINESIFREFQHQFLGIIIFLVIVTGHYGGNLTHGEAYLLNFASTPAQE
jgi:uncharacterized membrane protein